MAKPDFKKDLEFAEKYESAIADYYGAQLSSDKRWDIELDGKTIELKIDRYFDSKNFFIETISDIKSGKIGGPYRSQQDKIDEFWYVFVDNEDAIVYKWKTTDLIKQLEPLKGWEINVSNRGWTTKGELIKRKELDCQPERISLSI